MLWFLENPRYFILVLMLVYAPMLYYGISSVQTESDEYIYYYMSYAISRGYTPYRDFFCAHMPLMIYPLGILYTIFGPSIALGKLVSLVSFFFVVFLTYLIGERYGKSAGVLACVLMLLSPIAHPYANSMYGLFLCLSLGLASFYFHITDRRLFSGFLIVLSMFVRLNIYPLFLFLFLLNRKNKTFYYGMLAAAPLMLFALTPNFVDNTILYHLRRTIYDVPTKTSMLTLFIRSEWLIISLSIIGALMLCFSRPRGKLSEVYRKVITEESREISLVFFTVLFFILTLAQRSLINYYFIFMLPFMAVIGALGIMRLKDVNKNIMRFLLIPPLGLYLYYAIPGAVYVALALGLSYFIKKKKVVFFTLGVVLCGIYFNYTPIVGAYLNVKIKSFDDLTEYVTENTVGGGKIAYIGYGNTYVALKSNRMLAGNFIDITDQMFFIYGDRIDQMLSDALKEDVGLAVVDLRHTYYIIGKGITFSKTMSYLRKNYIPVELFYDWGDPRQRRPLIVWFPLSKMHSGNQQYARPLGNETKYFFERYYFYLKGEPRVQEKVDVREGDVSQPYIPEALRGANMYNLTLIPENVFRWPIKEGDHYKIIVEDMVSEVWVASIKDDLVKFMVDTHLKDNTIAFSVILYNHSSRRVEYMVSFSRISDFVVNGFVPSYQQIPLTEFEYGKLEHIIGQLDGKNISSEEYEMLRTQILPNTNTTETIGLRK